MHAPPICQILAKNRHSLSDLGWYVRRAVASADMSMETYFKAVVPIAACFAGTLWLGNAAYLYLSVSFIQMLKVGLLTSTSILTTNLKLGRMKGPQQDFKQCLQRHR